MKQRRAGRSIRPGSLWLDSQREATDTDLFIRLDHIHDNWAPIRSTRGVIQVVRFNEFPLPVADEIVEQIRRRIEDRPIRQPYLKSGERVVLTFDGLDTYAKVALNCATILESDNMFIPARVDVSNIISFGSKNILEITFDSAWLVGKKIREQYPDHHWSVWNGDASRLIVRKAQYHYVSHIW